MHHYEEGMSINCMKRPIFKQDFFVCLIIYLSVQFVRQPETSFLKPKTDAYTLYGLAYFQTSFSLK